jgi:hypothetical protein
MAADDREAHTVRPADEQRQVIAPAMRHTVPCPRIPPNREDASWRLRARAAVGGHVPSVLVPVSAGLQEIEEETDRPALTDDYVVAEPEERDAGMMTRALGPPASDSGSVHGRDLDEIVGKSRHVHRDGWFTDGRGRQSPERQFVHRPELLQRYSLNATRSSCAPTTGTSNSITGYFSIASATSHLSSRCSSVAMRSSAS